MFKMKFRKEFSFMKIFYGIIFCLSLEDILFLSKKLCPNCIKKKCGWHISAWYFVNLSHLTEIRIGADVPPEYKEKTR